MEEVSVQVEKVQAPILIPKLDLGFSCQYRNQVSVVHQLCIVYIFFFFFDIQEIQWSESKGSAADDGFTTELVAVKGKANVSGKNEEFSFMVKLTPEFDALRIDMVTEVRYSVPI